MLFGRQGLTYLLSCSIPAAPAMFQLYTGKIISKDLCWKAFGRWRWKYTVVPKHEAMHFAACHFAGFSAPSLSYSPKEKEIARTSPFIWGASSRCINRNRRPWQLMSAHWAKNWNIILSYIVSAQFTFRWVLFLNKPRAFLISYLGQRLCSA